MKQSKTMTGRAILAAALAVFVSLGVGAQSAPIERPAPASTLAAFDLWAGRVQRLDVPATDGKPFSVVVSIGGTPRTLDLKPYDVRANHFRLLVQDEGGIRRLPTPACVTYRGEVRGMAGGLVAAGLLEGRLTATVRLDDGSTWGVQPLAEVDPKAPRDEYIVFNAAHGVATGHRCGNLEIATAGAPGTQVDATTKVCEIGIDADYAFYQQNGRSVAGTQNDITNVMNAVSAIYLADVQIEYKITTILVRTTNAPYSTANPGGLLTQFRNEWNANQGGVQRDVAHLFTGINLSGTTIGIARISAICNLSIAYGLSQSRYTSNISRRVALTAHELGHNFSAQHCDQLPNCNIMCSGLGGCSRVVTSFGPNSIASISAFRNSRGCLSDKFAAPTLSTVSPIVAPALTPGNATLKGTNLDTVTRINFGSTVLGPQDFTVVSSSELSVKVPKPTVLGFVLVTVTNPGGTSNSLSFGYQKTSPQKIVAPLVGTGGQPFKWEIGGNPSDRYLLLIGFGNNNTFQFQNFNILVSFGVLTFGNLNGAGVVDLTFTPPAGPLRGVTIYSQAVFFNQTGSAFTGATNITATLFVF